MLNKYSNLDPWLRKALHLISVTGTFLMLFGLIYLILQLTIGMIPLVKEITVFEGMPLTAIVFPLIAILVIKRYIRISSPYE